MTSKKRGRSKAADDGAEEGADGMSLESRLERLDAIVAALEGGEVALEEGLALFEEGVKHIRAADALLSTAELRVEELVGDADAARTRPLGDDEA